MSARPAIVHTLKPPRVGIRPRRSSAQLHPPINQDFRAREAAVRFAPRPARVVAAGPGAGHRHRSVRRAVGDPREGRRPASRSRIDLAFGVDVFQQIPSTRRGRNDQGIGLERAHVARPGRHRLRGSGACRHSPGIHDRAFPVPLRHGGADHQHP